MRRLLPLLLLLFGTAALTLAVARGLDRGPFDRTPVGAEEAYWKAAGLQAQGKLDVDVRSQLPSPSYPLLLAPLAGGESATGARRTLTWITLPLFALLVGILTWRRAGAWPAVLAAWGTAAVAPIALDAGTFTPAVPGSLLALTALVVLDGRRPWVSWVIAGGILGLVLRFEPVLGWSLAVMGAALAAIRPGRCRRGIAAGGFALSLAVVLTGVHLADRATPPVPRISGVAVYQGHRVGASGVAPRRGDADEERWWTPAEYSRQASRDRGTKLPMGEVDAYWTTRAIKESLTHPLRELRRAGVRALGIYGGEPTPRAAGITFLLQQSEGRVLPISVWVARILLPLGLIGLVVRGRRAGAAVLIGALSGYLAASVTFVEADLRLVSVAALLVGVGHLVRSAREAGARKRVLLGGASAVSLAVFGLWPMAGGIPGHGVGPEDHLSLGLLFDREGRGSSAIREYERARSLAPGDPYPSLSIAILLGRDNAYPEAIDELEHLRRDHPDSVPTLMWLTRFYQAQKQWMEAASVYSDLIRLEPWEPEHLNNLGTMYTQLGLFDRAVAAFEAALKADPGYATAEQNLRSLQERGYAAGTPPGADSLRVAQEEILDDLRAGDTQGAEGALKRAYNKFGRTQPELIYMEGTLRLMTGESDRAVQLLESVRSQMAGNPIYLSNLGAAYVGAKRYKDAEKTFIEVLRMQPANEPIQRSLASVRAVLDSLGRSGTGH